MPTPEQEARAVIDGRLAAAGWAVQSFKKMNLGAGPGLAVTEFPGAHGPSDYLLYVDGKAVGVVEAKPAGHTLKGVEGQSAAYADGLAAKLPAWRRPLPFQYETTGQVTQFTNWMEPHARSRGVFSFHRPETLLDMVQQPDTLRGCLQHMPEVPAAGLWPKQHTAIVNLEKSLALGKPRSLIQMATGSGKTFTAANVAYRLVRFGRARRVLFLVDRSNLGDQTLKEFQQFQPPGEKQPFDKLYNVAFPRKNRFDPVNRVVISTIQRVYSILTNAPELPPEDEERSNYEAAPAFKKPPVPIYEELLSRSAAESTGGAGQYFTPRKIIEAVVEVMRPGPDDTIMDPAAGTGGFLTVAYQYVIDTHGPRMDRDQKRRVRERLVTAQELVPDTARLCAMNLYLHGIGSSTGTPVVSGKSSLDTPPTTLYSMVLTNPPFGKKQSLKTVTEEGELDTEDEVVVRQDFWASTANKQLNFVQHIFNLLKVGGRAAVVVPDNVLFEGGPGQKVREQLLKQCDVHTLLRLPTGIFYKPGVKANVLFFDRKPPREAPWTTALWVYDLRTNRHFTPKQKPIDRADFKEFIDLYKPGAFHERKPTWSEATPAGRWRCYPYDELLKRDKLSLDLFWLKDESLEDSATLPEPDDLARDIVDDLQDALEQFAGIAASLAKGKAKKG